MWIIHPNQYIDGKFIKAEFCGEKKNTKAQHIEYADEEIQYESFCPRHMYEWTQMRKAKAHRIEDDDIDFNI
jgi:hypothetical protein